MISFQTVRVHTSTPKLRIGCETRCINPQLTRHCTNKQTYKRENPAIENEKEDTLDRLDLRSVSSYYYLTTKVFFLLVGSLIELRGKKPLSSFRSLADEAEKHSGIRLRTESLKNTLPANKRQQ